MDKVYLLEKCRNWSGDGHSVLNAYSTMDLAIEAAKKTMQTTDVKWFEDKKTNHKTWITEDEEYVLYISERTLDAQ